MPREEWNTPRLLRNFSLVRKLEGRPWPPGYEAAAAADNASPRGRLNGGGMVLPQPNERALLGCLLAKLQVRASSGRGILVGRAPGGARAQVGTQAGGRGRRFGSPPAPGAPSPRRPQREPPARRPSPPSPKPRRRPSPPTTPTHPPQALDADVLVGHNISAFDLSVLLHRLQALKVPLWSRVGRLRRSSVPRLTGGGHIFGGGASAGLLTCLAGRLLCDTYLSGARAPGGVGQLWGRTAARRRPSALRLQAEAGLPGREQRVGGGSSAPAVR